MPTKNGAGFQQLQYVAVFVKQAQAKISRIYRIWVHTQIFAFGFCFCSDAKFYLHNL